LDYRPARLPRDTSGYVADCKAWPKEAGGLSSKGDRAPDQCFDTIVVVAENFNSFGNAITKKLIAEIAQAEPQQQEGSQNRPSLRD
jgi:hypothetical protein